MILYVVAQTATTYKMAPPKTVNFANASATRLPVGDHKRFDEPALEPQKTGDDRHMTEIPGFDGQFVKEVNRRQKDEG